MAEALDVMFIDPFRGGDYVATEMLIGALWSCAFVVSSSLFLYLHGLVCWEVDRPLTLWLLFSAGLRMLDLPAKLYLWHSAREITQREEDRRFLTRKLMKLVRGRVFHMLQRFTMLSYLVLVAGFVRVWQMTAADFPTFHHICVALLCFSVLKLLLSLVRLYCELANAEKRHAHETVAFLETGATLEQIEALPSLTLSKSLSLKGASLVGHTCAICIEEFQPGLSVKALPCAHIFHTSCIDRWLIEVQTCPLCACGIQHEKMD